jgi:monofunctional glycosyltransferase
MPAKFKLVLLGSFGLCLLLGGWFIYDTVLAVPDFSKLKESVEVPIRLANGDKAIRLMGPKTPHWTPLSAISEWLPRAVVSSEDGTFYSHKGIDVFEMQEALKKDLKEGRFARGASTITQQVLKNVYLSHYPKLFRKLKEIAWAGKLEAALTKPQILAFYLNMAEWGPGIYGVGDASRHYFATSPASLSPKQSAFLAMLLPSPRRYHAYFRQKQLTQWAEKRVDRILQVMMKLGQLPEDQYQVAVEERLWGNSVIADSEPGVAKDPGWDASESPDEKFEETAEAKEGAKRTATPLSKTGSPSAPVVADDPASAPSEPIDPDPALPEPSPESPTLD